MIFLVPPKSSPEALDPSAIPTVDKLGRLGSWTNENKPGDFYRLFCAAGAKTYGVRTVQGLFLDSSRSRHSDVVVAGLTTVKAKGLIQTVETADLMTPENLKWLVLGRLDELELAQTKPLLSVQKTDQQQQELQEQNDWFEEEQHVLDPVKARACLERQAGELSKGKGQCFAVFRVLKTAGGHPPVNLFSGHYYWQSMMD